MLIEVIVFLVGITVGKVWERRRSRNILRWFTGPNLAQLDVEIEELHQIADLEKDL